MHTLATPVGAFYLDTVLGANFVFLCKKIAHNLKTIGQILMQFYVVVYLNNSTSKTKSGHI